MRRAPGKFALVKTAMARHSAIPNKTTNSYVIEMFK
jgi:hypothetical protein